MLTHFMLDFSGTVEGAIMLEVEPKMIRTDPSNSNSPEVQASSKEGVLKWTVTLSVKPKLSKPKREDIAITVTSPTKPFGAIAPGTYVTVEELELGIMPQDRGCSLFYSAKSIRPSTPARTSSAQ